MGPEGDGQPNLIKYRRRSNTLGSRLNPHGNWKLPRYFRRRIRDVWPVTRVSLIASETNVSRRFRSFFETCDWLRARKRETTWIHEFGTIEQKSRDLVSKWFSSDLSSNLSTMKIFLNSSYPKWKFFVSSILLYFFLSFLIRG